MCRPPTATPPALALLLPCAVLCAGCPETKPSSKPGSAAASQPAATRQPAAKAPAGPPIAPISHEPLAEEAPAKVVEKLIRAHYDPERLGLTVLAFTARLKLVNNKGKTEIAARGSFRPGKAPEVELARVVRDGKEVARDGEFSKTIWTSLKYRSRRLLDGLGHGFLRRRLEHFKALLAEEAPAKGAGGAPAGGDKAAKAGTAAKAGAGAKATVKKVGERLELRFVEEKAGTTTFLIERDHKVVELRSVAPMGVTRVMRYEHATRDGRNLVKKATMSVKIDKDATLPQKGQLVMRAADGMTYHFRFVKAGRFFLPAHLDRTTPVTGDRISIDLKYN